MPPTVKGLPNEYKGCVIFDLDGTLANNSHRTHHISGLVKDWDHYHSLTLQDGLIPGVAHMFRACKSHGLFTVICTGRPDSTRPDTVAWLAHHQLWPNDLYMRDDADHRPNAKIKFTQLELVKSRHAPILFAVDDLRGTVQMFRENGILCFQPADNIEFP